MKKAILGALFAGAMLASCSNDDSIINGGDPFDGEQAFVKVKIAMADDAGRGTRATDPETGNYVNGTTEENNVYTIGFKFYGADGSFYGYGETIENPTVTGNGDAGAIGNNIEAKVEAVVALKINEGAPKPTKVVAYVNCENWKQEGSEPALSNISATTTKINGTKTNVTGLTDFAMTSSNYGTDGYATNVLATSFKETPDAAKADNTAVEIYVERLAAKVQVNTATDLDSKNDELTKGDYKLKFVMDGWDLGGINNSSYFIKNLDASWATTTPWSGWDATSDFRCFWAKDMNYGYEVVDDLDYKSWTEGHTNNDALYCCENTFAARENSTVNRYKVQPFVYVMGHYTVTKNNSTVTEPYLYNYADGIYPESAMIANMQTASGTIVYKQNATDNNKYDGQSLAGKVEIVSYTYKEGTNTITDASRVMLKLKAGADLKDLLIKNPDATSTEKYIAATEANVNEALAKTPVIAYGFKYDTTAGGYLAYFPVLIEHLNYNSTEGATQGVGAYGIVRNHVYNLTITEIKNLGIGVFNPGVDIIPDEKAKTLYLGAKINILSWKWVNQTVKL